MSVTARFSTDELRELEEFDRQIDAGEQPIETRHSSYAKCLDAVDRAMRDGELVYRRDALKRMHRLGLRSYANISCATGVDYRVLMDCVRRKKPPGRRQIVRMVWTLGVPVDALFEHDN